MKKLPLLLAAALAITSFGGVSAITTTSAYALTIKGPIAGGGPGRHPRYEVKKDDCGGELGYLRRVYEEEIDLVERASIVPICEQDGFGLMRSDGNAGAIRQHIADNDDIMAALVAANFRVEDVVGVRMTGDESAVIYVHTFHYR
jgi:hypothetical protein